MSILERPRIEREPEVILAEVAERHGLSVADIEGRSLFSRVLAARREAMALIYATGQFGTVDVGSYFDCRDHSTVSRAVRKYRAMQGAGA